jgi:DNA repair exonuclease SbcCD ATPase subunit
LFEQNLNFYTDYIFAERFSFTVKASQKGVSILVDRKKGRPDDVSDVRHLSGAESNNFRLLCLVALLPIIPNERRVNILILDEPTSHMCPVSRQKFNESFLPILREVVPSIYIITPHEDDVRDDACEWLITKRDGRSSLEVLH